ncbi:hypothetical protein AAMO2058_000393100 [Amorphochlora amoebiformis]
MAWLRKHKSKTYAANLKQFIERGCYRDLLQLAVIGDRDDPRELAGGDKDFKELELMAAQLKEDDAALSRIATRNAKRKKTEPASAESKDEKATCAKVGDVSRKEEKDYNVGCKRKKLNPQESVSLAAKWAPSEKGKFDLQNKLAKRLAVLLFPGDKKRMEKYRKLLSRLRKHLGIVEADMTARRWDLIQFDKVPSRALKLYKGAFAKHTEARYQKFLGDVKSGKKQIKSQGVEVHELVKYFMIPSMHLQSPWCCILCPTNKKGSCENCAMPKGGSDAATIEAQWSAIVKGLKEKGCLRDSMAVCDVSGSMQGLPMQVAIAMGILVAQLADKPFRGRLITFHQNPSWHQVPVDGSLDEMVKSVMRMEWGGSTNMGGVFDLILATAVKNNLPNAALPKTIFIFSDMQFNSAVGCSYKTLYQKAKDKYESKGYTIPQIVFWNLRATKQSFPVDRDAVGCSLVSGFSSDILKQFMDGKVTTPYEMMIKTVQGYNVVIDSDEI